MNMAFVNRTILLKGLIIILILIALFMAYNIWINSTTNSPSTTNNNATHESFANEPQLLVGNLVKYSNQSGELARPLPDLENRNIIRLENTVKLTGFKFMSSNPSEYRIFIGDTMQQLLDKSKRIEVVIPGTKLRTNELYNNKTEFENEDGTPRYTCSCIAIEMTDSTWPIITQYNIYGIFLNALSIAEFDRLINLPLKPQDGKTITNNMITLKLANDADQMVTKIIINDLAPGQLPSNNIFLCQIKYKHNLDNGATLYSINGPIRDRFINLNNLTSWVLYFDKPVLANYLELTFFDNNSQVLDNAIIKDVIIAVYGSSPSTRDLANYKLMSSQSNTDSRVKIGGTNCPSTAEMLNKQVQAQLICEALEYKDKAKNKRLAYERDKLYLQKLKSQEEEIQALQEQIGGLVKKKNDLADKSYGMNIEALEKELKAAETSRQEAEQYLKTKEATRDSLRFKFNLDPEFQTLMN